MRSAVIVAVLVLVTLIGAGPASAQEHDPLRTSEMQSSAARLNVSAASATSPEVNAVYVASSSRRKTGSLLMHRRSGCSANAPCGCRGCPRCAW
jgi:hypothetical protein